MGQKVYQHDLLQEFKEISHGTFTKDTTFETLKNSWDAIKEPKQIHSARIEMAPANLPCDALMTENENEPLLMAHADCQIAIFWDPIEKRLATAHAGWKGLVQEIYSVTVQKFVSLGSKPENLFVGISPSLGPENSEFKGWRDYFPTHFGDYQVKENFFALKEIGRDELIRLGILPDHISLAEECTYLNKEEYHSWRRDKSDKRNYTLAYINQHPSRRY